MSIVVTCSCTMTYRLPDRYAGKRCRCRECGGAIRVPREGEEQVKTRKRKRKRARAASEDRRNRRRDEARKTTRRLGSQEQEIMGERRALRRAYAGRPVSESMHQLSPLNLSGSLERPQTLGPPTRAPEAEVRRKRKKKRKEAEEARADSPKRRKTKEAADATGEKRKRRKTSKGKGKKASSGSTEVKGKAKGTAPVRGGRKRLPSRGAKAGRRTALAARRGRPLGARRASEDEGEEGLPPARSGGNKTMVLAVVAVAALCLLVGWAFGVGLSDAGGEGAVAGSDFDAAMAEVEQLKQHRQWTFARDKLVALEAEARSSGDAARASQIHDAFVAVDMMVQLSEIADDETKLATLISYADNPDASVRLGIAMELRGLSSQYEAQETLARLAEDGDAKVKAAARQGLIAAGGPLSIPYLAEAIESSAAFGGKLGEEALQRALELYEPEVVPVLIKALELRKNAPAPVVVAILEHLHELGEPQAAQAAQGFLGHEDPAVQAAAKRVVDDLS